MKVAKDVIERENPSVRAIPVKHGIMVTQDYRCDRVWVWTSEGDKGIVVQVPIIG